jgi:Holliday junction resolvase RusA-like endonuclease
MVRRASGYWICEGGVSTIILPNLPMPPSANALTRNADKKRVKTDAYAEWIAQAGWTIQQVPASERRPIAGPYTLIIRAQRPNMRRDLDNIVKPLNDLLKRHGLITDDRHCQRIEAHWLGTGSTVSVTIIKTREAA